MIYNIIGLAFDLIGVFLLFKFGILPNNLWEHLLMDSGMSEKDEKRHKMWSKIAVTLIFIGFSLQLMSSVLQYKSDIHFTHTKKYENINFKKKRETGTNIITELELKFDNNKLYYQLKLFGPSISVNYNKHKNRYEINLEDSEGFKIMGISESRYNNKNLSQYRKNDSLFITIKNSIPFKETDYIKIDRWNLTTKN